jgi:hypothetical protein
MSMRKIGALLAALTMVLSACDGGSDQGASTDHPRSDSDTLVGKDPEKTGRTAAVYAAVVRRLVTKDHTFGGAPSPFRRVYIVDGVVPEAGYPAVPRETRQPFVVEVRDGIARELADLPPIEFVSDPEAVIVDQNQCPRVKGKGVLISLGPISGSGRRVTVANGLFFACLGGQWLTYVLERVDGDWRVVGTKGPVAIS